MRKIIKLYDVGIIAGILLLLLGLGLITKTVKISEKGIVTPARVKIISQNCYSKYSHQGRADFGYIVEAKIINTGFSGPIKIGATLWTKTGKWTKYKTTYLKYEETQTVTIPFFEPSLWQKTWYSVWVEPTTY